jgi:hypothetical protein
MLIPERLEKMNNEEFQAEIVSWIRTHYSGVLGSQINLLKQENGMNLLQSRVKGMLQEKGLLKDENIRRAA